MEHEHLRNLLMKNMDKDHRNVVLILLALNTGGRASEILNLTKSDISPESRSVFIRGLKNSRDRELPLPEWLFLHLGFLTESLKPQDKIFPIALRTLQGIWHQYRPARKGFKSLRHTFAIRLYQRTKDIRLTQMALGHRSINNTMVYCDYLYSVQELQRILA